MVPCFSILLQLKLTSAEIMEFPKVSSYIYIAFSKRKTARNLTEGCLSYCL